MSNKKTEHKSFLVYYDNEIIVCRLPDDEAGKLFKSLFPYSKESIRPNFEDSPALAMAFDVLAMTIDRDKEKYEARCEKNRKNVSKRWEEKNTIVYGGKQSNTKDTYIDRDIEIDKDIDKDIDRDRDKDSINYQLIADMYNATCVSFPKLTKLSEKRKKAIKARMKIYSVDDFQKLFRMAEESSFLKGQNDRNWSATFDWLISDGNMAKVLDGNYSDKKPTADQASKAPREMPSYYKYLEGRTPRPDDPFQ